MFDLNFVRIPFALRLKKFVDGSRIDFINKIIVNSRVILFIQPIF